jgi:hypothetical protein
MSQSKQDQSWFHIFLETWFEKIIRWIFFWESDDKKLGVLLRFLHHSIVYTMGILYVLNHTIIPSYILFCFLYFGFFIVWTHHIITGGCLSSKVEQRLIGDSKSFVDPILEAFHIPITDKSTAGTVILGSTLVMSMLTFELTSRSILNIRHWFNF